MIQKDKNVPGFIASVGSAPFARVEEPAPDAAALHAEPARLREHIRDAAGLHAELARHPPRPRCRRPSCRARAPPATSAMAGEQVLQPRAVRRGGVEARTPPPPGRTRRWVSFRPSSTTRAKASSAMAGSGEGARRGGGVGRGERGGGNGGGEPQREERRDGGNACWF